MEINDETHVHDGPKMKSHVTSSCPRHAIQDCILHLLRHTLLPDLHLTPANTRLPASLNSLRSFTQSSQCLHDFAHLTLLFAPLHKMPLGMPTRCLHNSPSPRSAHRRGSSPRTHRCEPSPLVPPASLGSAAPLHATSHCFMLTDAHTCHSRATAYLLCNLDRITRLL